MTDCNLAIQLYSVREALKADFSGTLAQLQEIGFTGVELAFYYGGLNPAELAATLQKFSLRPCGIYESAAKLQDPQADVYQYAKALGCQYLTLGFGPDKIKQDCDGCLRELQQAVQVAAGHGCKICYHAHSHEFARVGGVVESHVPPRGFQRIGGSVDGDNSCRAAQRGRGAEPARVAEEVQDALAAREPRDQRPVVPLVQVKAGLLPAERAGVKREPAFMDDQLLRRDAVDLTHAGPQAFQPATLVVAPLVQAFRPDLVDKDARDLVLQSMHPQGEALHDQVARVGVDDEPGDAVPLRENKAITIGSAEPRDGGAPRHGRADEPPQRVRGKRPASKREHADRDLCPPIEVAVPQHFAAGAAYCHDLAVLDVRVPAFYGA